MLRTTSSSRSSACGDQITCYASAPYCPLEYVLAEDMRYYAKTGLDTWIDDTSVGGDLQPIDTNWQMDEMIAYHRLRRELWERAPGWKRN